MEILSRYRKLSVCILAAVAFFLFPAGESFAAGRDQSCPWAHSKSDLAVDPALESGVLKNGFRYVLLENRQPRDRVSMHLMVEAGSLQESDQQQGAAHFLEHMMFNGSEQFEPGELVKYFQRIGMALGPDANARTGFGETIYDVYLPKGGREEIAEGLRVLKDFAGGALLLPVEIDKERKVILSEKRTRDSTGYRTNIAKMHFSMPEARMSARLPIGQIETLRAMDRRRLKHYYDTWYRPESTVLVMVGDFEAESVAAHIRQVFARLTPRAAPQPEPPFGRIQHQGLKPFFHFEAEAGKTSIGIEVLERVTPTIDSFNSRKKRLLKDLANQILRDRLDRIMRQPAVPFTSAAIKSGIFLRRVKYARITAECSPDNWQSSLATLEKTLRQAIQFGFGMAELQRVKKDFIARFDRAVERMPTRESRNLSRSIINSARNGRVFQSPVQRRNLYAPVIAQATLEEVNEAFRLAWAPDHRLIFVTGNAEPGSADPGSDSRTAILSVFEESRQTAVLPPTKLKSVAFPYLPEPEGTGRVLHRNELAGTGIVQVEFGNHLRLNLKTTDFKAKEILIDLTFGNGRADEPVDQPGLAILSPAVVKESGLGALDRDELERALAGKQTRLRFGVGEDRFYFRGRSVTGELRLLFQLLRSHLVDPGFRREAYDLVMDRYKQTYRSLSTSVNGAMRLQGDRFLSGGDSRFGMPPQEHFRRLTLEQIAVWVGRALVHAPLEVSLVGDFDTDTAIAIAGKYLGTLPVRKATDQFARRTREIVFPKGQFLQVAVETRIPKGLVITAFPSKDLWDIGRTRRLSMLAAIFSDRMREDIREKLGVSYSQSAVNLPARAYPGYGVLKATVHVDPDDSALVLATVKHIAADMAAHGILQEELNRARAPILSRIKDLRRTNSYWLSTVLSGSTRHPRQLEWPETVEADYAAMTTPELSRLARSYLDPAKAAAVVIAPAARADRHTE